VMHDSSNQCNITSSSSAGVSYDTITHPCDACVLDSPHLPRCWCTCGHHPAAINLAIVVNIRLNRSDVHISHRHGTQVGCNGPATTLPQQHSSVVKHALSKLCLTVDCAADMHSTQVPAAALACR
jgi:hypothetical protein